MITVDKAITQPKTSSAAKSHRMGDVPAEIATILKKLRQVRELSESGGFEMLAYILRMAETEAIDIASETPPSEPT